MQTGSVEKDAVPPVPDGVQEIPDTQPPTSIVHLPQPQQQQQVEPTAPMIRQPSFHGARPRRSCLRRQSTATTVCSAGAGSAAGEGGVSDELKVVLQVDPREQEGRQECLPSAPVAPMTRSVSFSEKANVQEYGMILGDNPCVDRGPPLTLSWEVQNAYSKTVIDHKNPRRGVQLRIPANLRTEVVSVTASQAEINKATFEVRKLRSQRHSSVAMQEFEGIQILWQSAVRKLQRWQRKKKLQRSVSPVELSSKATYDIPSFEAPSPAEAWLEANTTRRDGKLVLKPGVPPYDPSTALTVGEMSAEQSLPFSTAPVAGSCTESSATAESSSTANVESWTLTTLKNQESQAQHQRTGSEDDSQETAPTVVSAVDDDASTTDEEESPSTGPTVAASKGVDVLV